MIYTSLKQLKKDCTTCHFNFGEGVGCASAHYGVEVEEIMKNADNFPCDGYKIDYYLYTEFMSEGKIEL